MGRPEDLISKAVQERGLQPEFENFAVKRYALYIYTGSDPAVRGYEIGDAHIEEVIEQVTPGVVGVMTFERAEVTINLLGERITVQGHSFEPSGISYINGKVCTVAEYEQTFPRDQEIAQYRESLSVDYLSRRRRAASRGLLRRPDEDVRKKYNGRVEGDREEFHRRFPNADLGKFDKAEFNPDDPNSANSVKVVRTRNGTWRPFYEGDAIIALKDNSTLQSETEQ